MMQYISSANDTIILKSQLTSYNNNATYYTSIILLFLFFFTNIYSDKLNELDKFNNPYYYFKAIEKQKQKQRES